MADQKKLTDEELAAGPHVTTGKTVRVEYNQKGETRFLPGSKYRVRVRRKKHSSVQWPKTAQVGEEVELFVNGHGFPQGSEVRVHIAPDGGQPGPKAELTGRVDGDTTRLVWTPVFEPVPEGGPWPSPRFVATAQIEDKTASSKPLLVVARLQLVLRVDTGEPARDVEFVLCAGEEGHAGTSDAEGRIDVEVHPAARKGSLAFYYDDGYRAKIYAYELQIELPGEGAGAVATVRPADA